MPVETLYRSPTIGPESLGGVPVGGIGAGCIEFGADGRFRNATINNNRSADERIAELGGAFLAVRARTRHGARGVILQDGGHLPFEAAGIAPPYVGAEALSWRGAFPCAHYGLRKPPLPVEVRWTASAPIVPYDTDASTMPVIFFAIYMHNGGHGPAEVAALANWENLRGCTATRRPEDRGAIRPLTAQKDTVVPARAAAGAESPHPAGLEFGHGEPVAHSADGSYALLARRHDGDVSYCTWDRGDPQALAAFWNGFVEEGRLSDMASQGAHCGAVCTSFVLEPGEARTVLFVLGWHCPRYVLGGRDVGNGYTVRFRDAVECAAQGLRHFHYFAEAIEGWHQRLLASSLPGWFNRLLLNGLSILTTNTLYTAEGRFALLESPETMTTVALDRAFHSALPVFLLFPELAQRELAELATHHRDGRMPFSLGAGSLHEPAFERHPGAGMVEPTVKFVLLGYRDFFLTGRRSALDTLYPAMRHAMGWLAARAEEGGGLPAESGPCTAHEDISLGGPGSYTAGLWLAALRAMNRLERFLGHADEARLYEDILANALEVFEERLWDDAAGHYRLDAAGAGGPDRPCHTGQLAGQWYADFLALGPVAAADRVDRALDTLLARNERRFGMVDGAGGADAGDSAADAVGRPGFYLTEVAALLAWRGRTDEALRLLQRHHKLAVVRHGRAFNMPFAWDLGAEAPLPGMRDRHISAGAPWHVLQAIQGFYMNVPEQTIWIRPNLPEGVASLNTPLVTPLSLGWLSLWEVRRGRYEQQVQVSFASPVHARTIVLRVPAAIGAVEVLCESPEGEEDLEHVVEAFGNVGLLEIRFPQPILIGGKTTITVLEWAEAGRERAAAAPMA